MKKILVIDNHPVMLKFMTSLLEKAGHQAVAAFDGLSAMEVLKTYDPDVIFVDLVMPNISGDKLCRIIRDLPRLQRPFIVIVSAIAAEENLDFKSFGADACIAKGPFHKMSEHVLEVLKASDTAGPNREMNKIIGLDEVFQRDVTKELLISKRHTETILNNLSEGILEITREGQIIYVNRTATSLIGTPEEKLLGQDFAELFLNQSTEVKGLVGPVFRGEQLITDDSTSLANGKQVSLTVLPVKDVAQPSAIVILKDITQQKRLEAHLEHAQKMDAIATLAGGIAHQFNNALFAISGNLELLQMVIAKKEKLERYIEPMKPALNRMVELTSQLLAYAREGKYKPQKVSLNDLVETTVSLIRYTLNASVDLSMDLAEDLHEVHADLAQMQMVLSALIANSAEAIESRGRIRILTANQEVSSEFAREHPGLKIGSHVRLTIEDDGMGMSEEVLTRIFEPFFTTKFQGRGLSMAAAYGTIRNHNGWISVESKRGKGTAVHIFLPSLQPEVKADAVASHPDPGTETILVVEDEAPVMEISRAMLEHLGYRILEARTGKEAISLAKTYDGRIDLAMLDIGLPDMEGHMVYPIIKKVRPNMRVAVCSGYALDGHAQEILNSGAQGFIQKPYTLATLSAKLKEVLERRAG